MKTLLTKLWINVRRALWVVTGQATIEPQDKDRPGSCPYCRNWTPVYAATCRCGRTGRARLIDRTMRRDEAEARRRPELEEVVTSWERTRDAQIKELGIPQNLLGDMSANRATEGVSERILKGDLKDDGDD